PLSLWERVRVRGFVPGPAGSPSAPLCGRRERSDLHPQPSPVGRGSSGLLPEHEHAEDSMALTFPTRVEQYTIPETMRSAVLFGPRDIRVVDRPVPQPGPGEVL